MSLEGDVLLFILGRRVVQDCKKGERYKSKSIKQISCSDMSMKKTKRFFFS